MDIERRALYNLLRMNWLSDPALEVEPWQVEDYRPLSLKELFQRLSTMGLDLDQSSYLSYAETTESPEELTDLFLQEANLEPSEEDKIYLIIFELWRRLIPEKLCLSIFCDELDHQIYLYDINGPETGEQMQDALANLQMILDENSDHGVKPSEIFQTVCTGCANDLESFLYDYIADLFDNDNVTYATELLEGFSDYVKGSKWFDLLKVRMLETTDPDEVQDTLRKLAQKASREDDLIFSLEVLAYLVQGGGKEDFTKLVRKTVPQLETEEEFQELLSLCGDFFRCIDEDDKEQSIQSMIGKRSDISFDEFLDPEDPDINALLKIIR